MTAPCIVRLDRAIAETGNGLEKAYLLAEKACYLTRVGDYANAESIRTQLRQAFGDGRDLKVSVLVMLLEGLQSFYQCLGGDARDRLMRAQLLSQGAKSRELTALTSAWLSHVQFNEGDTRAALESLSLAAEMVDVGQWATLSRISSVLGDIFMSCGEFSTARQWHSHARYAAVSYGDQAAVGAISYNQAAFRVFDLRLKSALGLSIDQDALQLADAEIRSACNYQIAARVTSLQHLLTSVQVGIDMLSKRYDKALDLLLELLREGEIPGTYPYRSVLQADAILCFTVLGRHAEAIQFLSSLMASQFRQLPLDDQVVVLSTLNMACKNAPEVFKGRYSHEDTGAMSRQLSAQRAALAPILGPFNEIPQALRWQTNEH